MVSRTCQSLFKPRNQMAMKLVGYINCSLHDSWFFTCIAPLREGYLVHGSQSVVAKVLYKERKAESTGVFPIYKLKRRQKSHHRFISELTRKIWNLFSVHNTDLGLPPPLLVDNSKILHSIQKRQFHQKLYALTERRAISTMCRSEQGSLIISCADSEERKCSSNEVAHHTKAIVSYIAI